MFAGSQVGWLVKATHTAGSLISERLVPARPGSSGPTLIVGGALKGSLVVIGLVKQTAGRFLAIASQRFSPSVSSPATRERCVRADAVQISM